MEREEFSKKSYVVSPLSYKVALILAAAGADGITADQLLEIMGFTSKDEMNKWFLDVKTMIEKAEFNSDETLQFANSIWNNADVPGTISDEFKTLASEKYGATVENVAESELVTKVNAWVNEQTNGLIPSIIEDASEIKILLANALYLKDGWISTFDTSLIEKDKFTTIEDEIVEKDFMSQQSKFKFFEDDYSKVVSMPMHGGVNAIFILGETYDVLNKIEKAESQEVQVKIPKVDLTTSLGNQELKNFLLSWGMSTPFDDDANFYVMCPDGSVQISDILQKAKLTLDENGIEAAAATAVVMDSLSASNESTDVKEFIANEPFTLILTLGNENPQILFYSRIVD